MSHGPQTICRPQLCYLVQLVPAGGGEEDAESCGGVGCSGLASPVVCGGGRWEEVMLVPVPPVCSGPTTGELSVNDPESS